MGLINISFRLGRQYRSITCRVVRNLIHDFVLGWDFFYKYDAQLFAHDGYLLCQGEKVDLIENSRSLGGAQYAALEEVVIPPRSKAHFPAALLVDSSELANATDTVCLEPFDPGNSDVCTARSLCKVQGGMLRVEAINPFEHPIKIPEGTALGYAEFVTDEEIEGRSEYAGMDIDYCSEDSAYESMSEAEANSETEESAFNGCSSEGDCDREAPLAEEVQTMSAAEASAKPAGESITAPFVDPGERQQYAWKVDYTKMAPEAKEQEEAIRHLFEVKHEKVMAKHERDYGCTNLTKHHARLIDKTPIATRRFRCSPDEQKRIDKQVDEMLADGLLSHSTSPYSAPILLVAKKEPGKFRFVTDFRKVNAATQKVVYPLPKIEDALHRLENPRFFTSMDLVKGFWQVPIAEEDRHIYAFSTGSAHVEYNVMPMGAKNSTSTLQALMGLLLRGLPAEHVIAFLDDILVASPTVEEHMDHLDKVLTALGRANLKLHPGKCAVARESATCLGHLLTRQGIQPDPHNLAKVVKWPIPSNVKEVRGFLGLTGYYRQFVENYAKVAGPLTDLTSKEKTWSWGKAEQAAFESLRKTLTEAPIIAYPDFEKPFWVKTDASGGSVGYVLTQFHDGKERVISYGSKKLDATQRRWSTYDREFFGLLTGIRNNSHYLRLKPFMAVTDHRPLLAWRKQDAKKDVTGRRMRWVLELESYDFELIYRQGKKHSDADALSRLENEDEDCATDDDLLEGLDEAEPPGMHLLGMLDQDTESAVKYTCLSSCLKKLKHEQDGDPKLSNLKGYVRSRRKPPKSGFSNWYRRNFKNFLIKNGVLYMKRLEPLTDLVTLRSVIPSSLVGEVLQDAHGSMLAGHPGRARMVAKLERSVVWEGMADDVKRHIEKCRQCDLVREHKPAIRTPLQPVVARKVGDHVICDLLKLPTAPGNFNYVLVCMDIFSKYVNLYKLKTKEAPGVANCIQDLCLSRGFPKKLGTDNGSEFDNHILNSAAKLMGIEKATSVVYRPQSQGAVERHNRQIIGELKKRLQQHGKSWTEHLPFVQYAYNSTPHSKTGESPFRVVFGREAPLPQFDDVDIDHHKDKSVRKYVEDLQERLQTIHAAVRERTDKRVEKEKEQYDKKAKHSSLEKGDLVYEKQNVKTSKLDTDWRREPVTVLKRCKTPQGTPGYTYVVKRTDGSEHRRNLEQLKPVKADFPVSDKPEGTVQHPETIPTVWDSDTEDPLITMTRLRPLASRPTFTALPAGSGYTTSTTLSTITPLPPLGNLTPMVATTPSANRPLITTVILPTPVNALPVIGTVPSADRPTTLALPTPIATAPVISTIQLSVTPPTPITVVTTSPSTTMVTTPTLTTVVTTPTPTTVVITPIPTTVVTSPTLTTPKTLPEVTEGAVAIHQAQEAEGPSTGPTAAGQAISNESRETTTPPTSPTRAKAPLEIARVLSVQRPPPRSRLMAGTPDVSPEHPSLTPSKIKARGKGKASKGRKSIIFRNSGISSDIDLDVSNNPAANESIGSFSHFLNNAEQAQPDPPEVVARYAADLTNRKEAQNRPDRPQAGPSHQAAPIVAGQARLPNDTVTVRLPTPQQANNQPPHHIEGSNSESEATQEEYATAYEDSSEGEQKLITPVTVTRRAPIKPKRGPLLARVETANEPRYNLRRGRINDGKRGSEDMDPPVDSPQSSKCILYDQIGLSVQPSLNFTPTGQRLSVITFQQQPSQVDGNGRASAYRAVAGPQAVGGSPSLTGDNSSTDRHDNGLGSQDINMEADECFDYL